MQQDVRDRTTLLYHPLDDKQRRVGECAVVAVIDICDTNHNFAD